MGWDRDGVVRWVGGVGWGGMGWNGMKTEM